MTVAIFLCGTQTTLGILSVFASTALNKPYRTLRPGLQPVAGILARVGKTKRHVVFDDMIYPLGQRADLPVRVIPSVRSFTGAEATLREMILSLSQPPTVDLEGQQAASIARGIRIEDGPENLYVRVSETMKLDGHSDLLFRAKLCTSGRAVTLQRNLHILFALMTAHRGAKTSQTAAQVGFSHWAGVNLARTGASTSTMPMILPKSDLTDDVWAGFRIPESSEVATLTRAKFRAPSLDLSSDQQSAMRRYALLVVRECADGENLAIWDTASRAPEIRERSSLASYRPRRYIVVRRDSSAEHCDVRVEDADTT
ncbi:hypothetical protein PYCC9005_001763 [Savitreella phatthalungensis]